MKHFSLSLAMLSTMLSFATVALAQTIDNPTLRQALEAHGGYDTFQKYHQVEYDLKDWPFSQNAPLNDHQTANLDNRNMYIKSDSYELGYNGQEVWASNAEALGLPADFYYATPFYFFSIPFVFADPGANVTSMDATEFEGEMYDAIKVTYGQGVGASPDDNYVAYFNQDDHTLKLVHYVVTHPSVTQGKPIEELSRSVIVYESFQEADGLQVPQTASFYGWEDGKLGEKSGTIRFENVSFSQDAPAAAMFEESENRQN